MSEKSEWLDVLNFEGHYKINKYGDIMSLKSNKILKTFEGSGYNKVSLCKNGKIKKYYIHRLIAQHFIGNPKKLLTVNHKNGERQNNSLSNLEWSSYKQQELHKNRIINKRKRGVYSATNGSTWYARLKICNIYKYLGSFKNKNDAYDKYYEEYIKTHRIKPW